MYRFVRHIIDSLFPPRMEALLVDSMTKEDLPRLLRPQHLEHVVALASFGDPQVKALIHEAKFHHSHMAYALLAQLLSEYLASSFDRDETCVFIPVPLSPERERARGYNQVAEVLRAYQTLHPRTVVMTESLIRIRDTAPQTSLGREARLTNMRGAFTVKESRALLGKNVVLIDDVCTTGATLRAAEEAFLSAHPQSLTLIALAH